MDLVKSSSKPVTGPPQSKVQEFKKRVYSVWGKVSNTVKLRRRKHTCGDAEQGVGRGMDGGAAVTTVR
eukprot:3161618-Rhodomonas_salina.1